MNGTDIKKAAINKAKQVAQAANGNGGKKRRKGQDLKPIITTEQQAGQNAPPGSQSGSYYKYVPRSPTIQHHHHHYYHRRHGPAFAVLLPTLPLPLTPICVCIRGALCPPVGAAQPLCSAHQPQRCIAPAGPLPPPRAGGVVVWSTARRRDFPGRLTAYVR